MDLELKDRTFLVTGGTAGLGFGIAEVLVREGAHVAVCGRDSGRLADAAERLGGDVLAVCADVTRAEDIEALVAAAGERWGRLDGLVSNAGVHTSGTFVDTSDEEWQADFELKLLAAVRLVRTALPLLRAAEGGASVLSVLSIFARFQPARSMPSSVYRSAGLALTKGLSNELAADRIRVNALLVGFIRSDQWVRAAAATGEDVADYERRRATELGIPLGRAGTTEEFADLAAFVLSPRAGYLTGTALNVDGGLSPVV
ncbi:SDR family oxidoreductase [Pseudonocardia sp. RS11V-5]|uniref:SDR family NAD(P)-dependent oxidoreductase n=1 Tax=Pseudonocardia terrae TaxID=2905831 RepID=UPI001E535E8C|nr:SDR family oxidoreductase [Pseudonocardia terrae]MCE3550865.1 SDR family oxidoreductase [Pseudonocardia terrae]